MHAIDDFRLKQTFVSPKGSEFTIKTEGHLFVVHMANGGVRPEFTQQKFTSHKKAIQAIENYFASKPAPREKIKDKTE